MPSTMPSSREFLGTVARLRDAAVAALRNRDALDGISSNANWFHQVRVSLARSKSDLLKSIPDDHSRDIFSSKLTMMLEPLVSISTKYTAVERVNAVRSIELLLSTDYPSLLAVETVGHPNSEQVLPMSVVSGTRGYIESLAAQANGSYEQQWFDATALIMRRLVEVLALDILERHESLAALCGSNGRLPQFSDIIEAVCSDSRWMLNKQTVDVIESVRDLGNLAAHQRRFNVRKPDVDSIRPRFRLAIEELIHLARYDGK
ncbi:MAG: hypothetical protein KF745_00405 [Phycisphaeraceae bacterium]|nr:hypothetical protein [Phycisphaeraceae bacterium]